MPRIQTTKVYAEIDHAVRAGYTTRSEQGSSRSGKTRNTEIWLCVYMMNHPGLRLSVVRKTLTALRGSVLLDFKEVLVQMGLWGWNKSAYNKSSFTFTFPNGSWIEFFSTDDEQKLRGRKRDICYVNEANELSYLEWQQLKMRTTMFTIADYNPSFSDEHWLCTVNADPRTYHFITTYKDNPFLEQTIVDEIESLRDKNQSLWRIYGLGLQAIVEGLVFTNVDYVDEVPASLSKRFRGIDFGYENDPTAIIDVWFRGNEVWIDELCYQTHMLTTDIVKVFKDNNPAIKTISESADPRLVQEIYRAGVNIHPVRKFQGSVQAGIQKMQEYKFHVTRRSTNITREFKNYTWAQDKEGKWLNQPIDAFNHCFVGETPILTATGYKPICRVLPGELVVTSDGYRQVLANHNNGYKEALDFCLDFGIFKLNLVCTADHKIKTSKGWKRIQDLKPGDTLYVSQETLNARTASSLTGRLTSCTRGNDITPKGQNGCMSRYGNSTMAKSLRGARFITRILTALITIYQTLSALLSRSTRQGITIGRRQEEARLNNLHTLKESEKRQASGMGAKKAGSGTGSTESKWLSKWSPGDACAKSAALSSGQREQGRDSAPITASQSGDGIKGLTMSPALANGAERSLRSTATLESVFVQGVALHNITVASSSGIIREVFDLTVEGNHEYIANGVVVHNCIDALRYIFLMEVLGGVPKPVNMTRIANLAGY